MSSSAASLLAALADLRRELAVTGRDHRSRRQQLDLLAGASDADAATAIAADPDELGRMLGQVPLGWLDDLGERPALWLSGALVELLTRRSSRPVRPVFDAMKRLPAHRAMLPALEVAMRAGPWRQVAAEHLLASPFDEAQGMLLAYDGPDLDVRTRLDARLQLSRPPSWPAMSPFLGPAMPATARREALRHLASHDLRKTLEPPFVALIEAYLDDSIEPGTCFHLLQHHADPAVRRRLFDRLWPVAQSQRLPLPWPGIELWRLFSLLVLMAPSPDLLAALLDELHQRDWSRALVQAIEPRPDPHLVPALTRWLAGKPKTDQRLAEPVIEACRRARPWTG